MQACRPSLRTYGNFPSRFSFLARLSCIIQVISLYNIIKRVFNFRHWPLTIHITHSTFLAGRSSDFQHLLHGVVLFRCPLISLPVLSPRPLLSSSAATFLSMVQPLRINATDRRIANSGSWNDNHDGTLTCMSECQLFLLFRGSLHA